MFDKVSPTNWLNLVSLFKLLFLIGPVVLNVSKCDSNLVLNKAAAEPMESSLARWIHQQQGVDVSPVQHRWAREGQRSPECTHQYFNKFCSAHTKAQKKRPEGQMLKGKQHIRNREICVKLPNWPCRGCWPKHSGFVSVSAALLAHIHF